MRKKTPLAEDIERVRRFQAWVKQQRGGLSYVEAADNYNRRKNPEEPSIGPTALRRLEDRIDETTTIRRDTCRTVSLALGLPYENVLVRAGFLPDDPFMEKYVSLNPENKATIQKNIEHIYASQEDRRDEIVGEVSSSLKKSELPVNVRHRYAVLSQEAKRRVHCLIRFEFLAMKKQERDL